MSVDGERGMDMQDEGKNIGDEGKERMHHRAYVSEQRWRLGEMENPDTDLATPTPGGWVWVWVGNGYGYGYGGGGGQPGVKAAGTRALRNSKVTWVEMAWKKFVFWGRVGGVEGLLGKSVIMSFLICTPERFFTFVLLCVWVSIEVCIYLFLSVFSRVTVALDTAFGLLV